MNDISIGLPITLGAFLKVSGAAATGGHAKLLVQEGEVTVNGKAEEHRGRKLAPGDVVRVCGEEYRVCSSTS